MCESCHVGFGNNCQRAFCQQTGIAKGVRRIVAVTRGLAHAAVERAKAFEQQLDVADGINDLSLDTMVSWLYV